MNSLRGSVAVKVVFGVVATGIVFAALYYLFIDPYTSRLLQARAGDVMMGSASSEVKDAWYLLSPPNGGGVYHNGELEFSDYIKDGSIVTDIAVADDGETVARIKYSPDGTSSGVSVNGIDITASEALKGSLAISPNGTRVSFASVEHRTAMAEHDSWRMNVVDVNSREQKEYEGFAGAFVTDEEILLYRQDGVHLVNVVSGADTHVVKKIFLLPNLVRTALSQNRDHFAWSEGGNDASVTKVYEIRTVPEIFVMQVGEIPAVRGPIAVTEESVYSLAREGDSTKLTKHAFTGGGVAVIRTFPSILNVIKIIP